ncbi:MAG: hypothetical protein WA637_19080, partial [Terriglobales bacterium]
MGSTSRRMTEVAIAYGVCHMRVVPLRRLTPGGRIDLPFDGTIEEMFANPAESGVYIRSSSWTKSPVYLHYDPKANSVMDTRIIPPSPVDFTAITSEEVKAKAIDDTLVPLSIIHRRDLKLDGSHHTLLHGYRSYAISYDPKFDPSS